MSAYKMNGEIHCPGRGKPMLVLNLEISGECGEK
jgi:hypothetical protein